MTTLYKPGIHFNRVNFSIEGNTILNNITGSFPDGKITALIGPSGAGKTTLLKLCNGLISPTKGEIYIHDQLIRSYNPIQLRRHVGIALQNAPMINGTVFDNLALPRKLQGENLTREEAVQYLTDVGLETEFLDHDARKLSGGQRQKVSIARTLVNQSQILLLDEITSALDPTSLREIEALIIKINQKYHVTIIWITHNLSQAKKMGDYIWIMMDGQLMEAGEISLLDEPTKEQTKLFLQEDDVK